MKKIVCWHFTLKTLSLLVLVLLSFAYQSEAQTPIDYPVKPWDQWVVYKDSNFGDYRKSDSAYHSGIDLTLKDSIKDGVNKPVYAIADGQVFKVDERKLGWSVVIKHTLSGQQFIIPEYNSQEYKYKQEKVSTIYSVYIHIKLIEKLAKKITQPNGVTVKKGEIIGYINEMPSGIVPHLHFEIRHPDAKQSTGGSMLYPNTNWSSSGDYLIMQTLVESGARNPLEFLKANVQVASPADDSDAALTNVNPVLQTPNTEKDGMVLIPAGEFQMGSNDNDDEKPVHTVYLDAFYIDKYEVTNAQYRKFMVATRYKAPRWWNDPNFKAPNQPVVGASWDDAVAYAKWAGKRLPTEAEWEKAARGGLVGKKYPWGDDISHENANYFGTGDIWEYTSPVGSFAPNGYGLYDMAGNVREWCSDWGDDYANSPKSNPTGPSSGESRVLRGGSWDSDFGNAYDLRVAHRDGFDPTYNYYVGFRCVMDKLIEYGKEQVSIPATLVHSTNFKQGQQAKVISDNGLKLRSSHEIKANDSNKIALIKKDDIVTILAHVDSGLAKDGYYWWYVQFGDKKGWCAEGSSQENKIFLEAVSVDNSDTDANEANSEDFFPLTKGTYWVYKGLVKYGMNEKIMTWKMEVVDTISSGDATIAIIKGHPMDLSWYEDGKSRGNYQILYGLKNGSENYILNDELFLDLPLTIGKKFGDPEQITRPDNAYCWYVKSKDQIQLNNIKGISSSRKMNRYRLVFQTNPDDTTVEYVQGIGITRYAYRHHGSVSETDLRLIEYGKGQISISPTLQTQKTKPEKLIAVIEMEKGGRITFKFYPKDAPGTVDNFIKLANEGFYNGLKFHRVIPGFVAQAGDPLGTGMGGPGYTIKDEFNSKKHIIGTVAMAKTMEPNSAGSQFYICLEPQPSLDGKYTVFGQVMEGMDVVNDIQKGDIMKEVYIMDSETNLKIVEYGKGQVLTPVNKSAVIFPVADAEAVPTITKVDPAMASAYGGTDITITGTGFKAAPVPTVTIGGNPATDVKVTAKTILKATLPAGAAGPADIVVQNAKAKVKSLPFKGFTYYEDVTAMTSIPDMATAPPEGIEAPAKIDVTFNQNVDPASVRIKAMDAKGAEVAGKVAQDETDMKMFRWTPDAPFMDSDYTLTVYGAKGIAAQNVMADMSVTFKVREIQSNANSDIVSIQKNTVKQDQSLNHIDIQENLVGLIIPLVGSKGILYPITFYDRGKFREPKEKECARFKKFFVHDYQGNYVGDFDNMGVCEVDEFASIFTSIIPDYQGISPGGFEVPISKGNLNLPTEKSKGIFKNVLLASLISTDHDAFVYKGVNNLAYLKQEALSLARQAYLKFDFAGQTLLGKDVSIKSFRVYDLDMDKMPEIILDVSIKLTKLEFFEVWGEVDEVNSVFIAKFPENGKPTVLYRGGEKGSEEFISIFDINGDKIAEIITLTNYGEGHDFAIYQLKKLETGQVLNRVYRGSSFGG